MKWPNFVIYGCLLFSACTKRIDNQHAQKIDAMRTQEARLSDIPIPLNTEPIDASCEDSSSSDKIILYYASPMKSGEIVAFYEQEMERLGWQLITSFCGLESLLNFSKPHRFCTISIRPGSKYENNIVIFTGEKNVM